MLAAVLIFIAACCEIFLAYRVDSPIKQFVLLGRISVTPRHYCPSNSTVVNERLTTCT